MSTRVTATSIIDAIVEDMRRRIFEGTLTQGTAQTEAEVSGHYEVARPTAKAAIERLVAEGLLERGLHKSARVKVLDSAEVRDIYTARAIVESEVVRRLATTATVPARAVAANDLIKARISEEASAIIDPDMDFHTALVNALGNKRTSSMYASLLGEVRLCMSRVQSLRLLDSAKIAAEHSKILEYIAAGDSQAAALTLEAHLAQARDLLANEIGPDLKDSF